MFETKDKETVVVVTPKGEEPSYIYQDYHLMHKPNNQPGFQFLPYNYGFVEGHHDSQRGCYDRIIISDRKLTRNERITTLKTGLYINVKDRDYEDPVRYQLVVEEAQIARLQLNIKDTMTSTVLFFKHLRHCTVLEDNWGFLKDESSTHACE